MRNFYLALAVVGALVPITFFIDFFGTGRGPESADFISALFVNGAAGGFTADLLISSFVFWLYMWDNRTTGPKLWPFVILNLLIGLSCALPAYLYSRSSQNA